MMGDLPKTVPLWATGGLLESGSGNGIGSFEEVIQISHLDISPPYQRRIHGTAKSG